MTTVFDKLCRGPTAIIDDQIRTEPAVKKLVGELKQRSIPVIVYASIAEAKAQIAGLAGCSLIVLDWLFPDVAERPLGVSIGDEGKSTKQAEVISFIKQCLTISTVPICILSAESKEEIIRQLSDNGVSTEKSQPLFVMHKSYAAKKRGVILHEIDKWITGHPHMYLTLWWNNKWRVSSEKLFCQLFQADPFWPSHFIKRFVEDGVDPAVAIVETMNQLVQTGISVDDLNISHCKSRQKPDIQTLKTLCKRLFYTRENIQNDIAPGDVFLKDGAYYLNIRPDCDTTKRIEADHQIYLIRGEPKKADDARRNYHASGRIVEKENEIVLLFLDDKDLVVFNKRNFRVDKYSAWKDLKICRVTAPYITQIRHRFCTYLGRYGLPSIPKKVVSSLFVRKNQTRTSIT